MQMAVLTKNSFKSNLYFSRALSFDQKEWKFSALQNSHKCLTNAFSTRLHTGNVAIHCISSLYATYIFANLQSKLFLIVLNSIRMCLPGVFIRGKQIGYI